MKLSKIAIIFIALVILAGAAILIPLLKETKTDAQVDKEIIFQARGKSYKFSDFPSNFKQRIFDIEQERYEKISAVIDEIVMNDYLDEEAKKKNITKKDLEKQLIVVPPMSDDEAKQWYDKNRASMSQSTPPFDQIKVELKRFLSEQKNMEKKTQLMAKIKSESNLKILMRLPEPPIVEIDTAGFTTLGNPNAKVTIVEFADYKCGHCKRAAPVVKKVLEKFKDKVKFVFINFPLQKAGPSFDIAVGAFCAGKQNKFWEYHYKAFENPNMKPETISELAKELKLNLEEFEKCRTTDEAKNFVTRGREEGDRIGLQGTPTIYFNGSRVNGYEEPMLIQEIEKRL